MGDLVEMVKDGETLAVHPTCVADHERNGWSIAPQPKPKSETQAEPSKARKPKGTT